MNSKHGFTMIEIMGAIAVIGILIAAVWVASAPYMARSRDTQRITDMTSLGNVFMAYKQSLDAFPSNYGS
jgi:prepilin-type N-terminal cleavage/methylation domain-containing protein